MQQLHKRLMSKDGAYAKWHQSNHHAFIHWTVFIIAIYFVTTLTAQAINPGLDQINTIVPSSGNFTLKASNNQLLAAIDNYESAKQAGDQTAINTAFENVKSLASARQAKLQDLVSTNPAGFLVNTFPEGLIKQFSPEVQNLLEQEKTVSGTYIEAHYDNQHEDKSIYKYQIQEYGTGKIYDLHLAKGNFTVLTGSKIKVTGTAIGSDILLGSAAGGSLQVTAPVASIPANGIHKTIVMLVNFKDVKSQPLTPVQAAPVFFSNDMPSVNTHYKEDSYGSLSFTGDVVKSWITVPYTQLAMCKDYPTMIAAADSAAVSLGYSPSNYQHKVYLYVAPSLSGSCPYAGYSSNGGNPSWSVMGVASSTPDLSTAVHELGHALGQNHASALRCGTKAIDNYSNCIKDEYGENTDPLGYFNLFNSNPAHKSKFGWITPSSIQMVSASGTYTIMPSETQMSGVQLLQIAKPDTNEYYLVGYRQPTGGDAALPQSMTNGAVIHISSSPSYNANTYLINATPEVSYGNGSLTDGRSFDDLANGITIKQISHDASKVTVQVNFGPAACVPSQPTLTLDPYSQTGGPGGTLPYTISVTNNDSKLCSTSTFNLSATAPTGWQTNFATPSFSLAPGTTASSAVTVTSPGTTIGGSYDFSVSTADAANAIHNATTTTYNYIYQSIPKVSITSPANGATVSGSGVNIAAMATDSSGINYVTFSIDGVQKANDTSSPYTYKWSLRSASVGTHTITATAVNKLGASATATITVTK